MQIKLKNPWQTINILCWMPVVFLLIDICFDNLGGNPIQALHIRLGDWCLRFLLITLLITPVQVFTKWRGMANYRQLFGLWSFAYGSLHVLGYLWVDHGWVWRVIFTDIFESSYIWFGIIAFLIVALLAVTSPDAAKKKLGKRWKKIHKLIYSASILAVLHYFWQLKGNLAEPVFYSFLLGFLLLFRLTVWFKNRRLMFLGVPKGKRKDELKS